MLAQFLKMKKKKEACALFIFYFGLMKNLANS